MPTQKQTLQSLLEQSVLLSDAHRKALINALPSMTPEQERQLGELLESGRQREDGMLNTAIHDAVTEKDENFLHALDSFLGNARSTLNKAEEKIQRGDERQKAESFFQNS